MVGEGERRENGHHAGGADAAAAQQIQSRRPAGLQIVGARPIRIVGAKSVQRNQNQRRSAAGPVGRTIVGRVQRTAFVRSVRPSRRRRCRCCRRLFFCVASRMKQESGVVENIKIVDNETDLPEWRRLVLPRIKTSSFCAPSRIEWTQTLDNQVDCPAEPILT